MKTITKTYKVYEFKELSEDVQDKVIEKLYDINTDYEWWDSEYEDFKTIGDIIGIDIKNIYFSGFSNQGDGARFEGRYEYKKDSVKKLKEYAPEDKELHRIVTELYKIQKRHFYKLSAIVTLSGHYEHEYCTDIDVHDNDYNYRDLPENVHDTISELLRDFMKWMYRMLNQEYDYLTSKEAIIETIDANDYTFLENGQMFNE